MYKRQICTRISTPLSKQKEDIDGDRPIEGDKNSVAWLPLYGRGPLLTAEDAIIGPLPTEKQRLAGEEFREPNRPAERTTGKNILSCMLSIWEKIYIFIEKS